MSDAVLDPRPGPAPGGLFLELATIGLGGILLLFRPWTGEVLDWPRLLVRAAPVLLCLIAAERALSRRIRRRTVGTYPTTPAVLVVLLGVSIVGVSVVNRARPSSARVVRARVMGFFPRARAGGNILPAPPVQASYDGLDGWIATVESWRAPAGFVHISLAPEEQRAASFRAPKELEVGLSTGLLGLEYVSGARLAPEP